MLREATRRVGVAPNAAYRHFADRQALVHAVAMAAMARTAVAMEAELDRVPDDGDPVARARARLRAVGAGYLRFARDEPGLFRTAYSAHDDLHNAGATASAGDGGLTPFQLLGAALDDLVAAGVLPPERRPGAEFLAWSAVHGLAMLLIDGPLRGLAPPQVQDATHRLLDMVENGLR